MVRAERAFFQDRGDIQAGLVAAWRMVARRYAGNTTVVGAVMLNEAYDLLAQDYPGTAGLTPASLHLTRFYDRVARAVHGANRDLVVFFGQHLSTETKLFAVARPPHLPYAVMDTEFYAPNWDPNGHRRIEEYDRLGCLEQVREISLSMAGGHADGLSAAVQGSHPGSLIAAEKE